jgi:hypothetical protein
MADRAGLRLERSERGPESAYMTRDEAKYSIECVARRIATASLGITSIVGLGIVQVHGVVGEHRMCPERESG